MADVKVALGEVVTAAFEASDIADFSKAFATSAPQSDKLKRSLYKEIMEKPGVCDALKQARAEATCYPIVTPNARSIDTPSLDRLRNMFMESCGDAMEPQSVDGWIVMLFMLMIRIGSKKPDTPESDNMYFGGVMTYLDIAPGGSKPDRKRKADDVSRDREPLLEEIRRMREDHCKQLIELTRENQRMQSMLVDILYRITGSTTTKQKIMVRNFASTQEIPRAVTPAFDSDDD
jgi:hypothetical protein